MIRTGGPRPTPTQPPDPPRLTAPAQDDDARQPAPTEATGAETADAETADAGTGAAEDGRTGGTDGRTDAGAGTDADVPVGARGRGGAHLEPVPTSATPERDTPPDRTGAPEPEDDTHAPAEHTPGADTNADADTDTDIGTSTSTSTDTDPRLSECLDDLRRVKAEYDNYRKRVHRDRLALREIAVANVLQRLLPVLDTIEGAREHGPDADAFERVVSVLTDEVTALGLTSFGAPGDRFDPTVHEALTYAYSTKATTATCAKVYRAGYRVGAQLLRPAQVAVTEPGPPAAGQGPDREPSGADGTDTGASADTDTDTDTGPGTDTGTD